MGKVIRLPERKPIPSKQINGDHAGQKYICIYDPNAPPHERWVWIVDFVRHYKFIGASPTAEAAAANARRRIHRMNKMQRTEEERE